MTEETWRECKNYQAGRGSSREQLSNWKHELLQRFSTLEKKCKRTLYIFLKADRFCPIKFTMIMKFRAFDFPSPWQPIELTTPEPSKVHQAKQLIKWVELNTLRRLPSLRYLIQSMIIKSTIWRILEIIIIHGIIEELLRLTKQDGLENRWQREQTIINRWCRSSPTASALTHC